MEKEQIEILKKSKNKPEVQKEILDTVKSLLKQIEKSGARYNENTYRELYLLTLEFSNRVNDIFSSENLKNNEFNNYFVAK